MASDGEQQRQQQAQPQGFTESLLGKDLLQEEWVRRWLGLSATLRLVVVVGGLAALLFVPYLGAVGLWDPWETHYGEVAREMVHRRDYVYPFWENAWFFSKPPLTMWLQALGMQMVGTLRGEGALGLYTEWGMRLPFALLSIAAVVLLALAVCRTVGMRAGLATGFVLATMPLYFLLTRQTVTDTPFVTTFVCAMACALIGQLDETTRQRSAWWYAFYVFCGLSALAKGLLGVGLPAVILVLYAALAVLPWEARALEDHLRWVLKSSFRKEVREGQRPMPVLWAQLFRMHLGTGILVFFAVALPWYLTLGLFKGVDDEGKLFWYRFFIHDHLNRLTAGVHTTTPGGTFIYFIEQGGFAIFPWVALVPGAFAVVSRLRLRSAHKADHLALIALVWVAFTFWLLGSSATKFHHYVFPVLPGLAILIALFIDRLWEEGIGAHAVSLLLGLVLFALVGKDLAENPKNFTDLFVYNYDRPYPGDLVTRPIALFASRPLWMADLLAAVLFVSGVYLALLTFKPGKPGTPGPRAPVGRAAALTLLLGGGVTLAVGVSRGEVHGAGLLGVGLLAVGALALWQSWRKDTEPRLLLRLAGVALVLLGGGMALRGFSAPVAADRLVRLLSQPVNLKLALGFFFTVGGAVAVLAALVRARTAMFAAFWALAFVFAAWFNWSHWVDLSHHWTQRDLFWRYYAQRKPGEPITAFLMNWRGETFYSRNTVKQIKDNATLQRYAAQPGREWALVEHGRVGVLRGAVGPDKVVNLIERDINNKFVLVTID